MTCTAWPSSSRWAWQITVQMPDAAQVPRGRPRRAGLLRKAHRGGGHGGLPGRRTGKVRRHRLCSGQKEHCFAEASRGEDVRKL